MQVMTLVKQRLNDAAEVSFGFNSGLEFITALYRTANVELFDETYADHHVSQDEAVIHLLMDLQRRLTPFMRRELDFFFKLEHSHADQALHQLMFTSSLPQSVSDLLSIVEETDPWEIIRYLIEDLTNESLKESFLKLWEMKHKGQQVDEADWEQHAEAAPEGMRILESVFDPAETKQRFLQLLRSFFERAYSHYEDQIASQCRDAVAKFERLYADDPSEFFRHYIGPDLELFEKETHIHVSLLTQYGSFVSVTSSAQVPHSIRLGINTDQAVNRNTDIEVVDKFCKAVSDKNRLEILRSLSIRPWYGQELAKKLGLSPAAVSYHMGFFYTVDLISLKRVDQKGYYVLDKNRLRYLFGLLQSTLNLG